MIRQDDAQQPFRFRGFLAPHYTMVPDEVFDELLERLSGAELKVLLYIIRRTFGFKKSQDAISINQMLHGIVRRDGTQLDHGCGVRDKKTLLKSLKSLVTQNIITSARQTTAEKGNLPSLYSLNVLESPLAEKSPQGVGGQIPPRPWGGNPATQHGSHDKKKIQHHAEPHASSGADDDASLKISKKSAVTEPVNEDLVRRLRAAGVSASQAKRLARNYPADRIEAELEALPFRNASNPAGYLVRAIEEGFVPPAGLSEAKDKAAAAERRKAREAAEKAREEAQRQAEEERFGRIEALYEQLSAGERERIDEEARAQLTKISAKFAADTNSPMFRAAVRNIVADRYGVPAASTAGVGEGPAKRRSRPRKEQP